MQPLTQAEVQAALSQADVQGWQLDSSSGEISHEYKFEDFIGAMAFVNKLATIAEEIQHHPDILIRYNRVRLSVVTHDANGLTDLDFQLAARANVLAQD